MKTSSPDDRKIFLASPGLLANPKNFRLMGGRRRRRRRAAFRGFFRVCLYRCDWLRNFGLGQEDVSSLAFVLGIFAGFQPVIAQGGIERAGRSAALFAVSLARPASAGRLELAIGESVGIGGGRSRFRSRAAGIEQQHEAGNRHQRYGRNQLRPIFSSDPSHLFSLRRHPSSDKFPVSIAA